MSYNKDMRLGECAHEIMSEGTRIYNMLDTGNDRQACLFLGMLIESMANIAREESNIKLTGHIRND